MDIELKHVIFSDTLRRTAVSILVLMDIELKTTGRQRIYARRLFQSLF